MEAVVGLQAEVRNQQIDVTTVTQEDLPRRFKRRSLGDVVAGFAEPGTLSRQQLIAPIDGQDLHGSSSKTIRRSH
jgi:hypothetical protein